VDPNGGQSECGPGGRLWAIGAAGALILAIGAGRAEADPPGLRRIDQRVADLDELSLSLRYLEPDLREDVGFQHLYVAENDPDRFVRVRGAMYAVSPRTDYWSTRDETYAIVSPGTVFYIGEPPELTGASAPAPRTPRGVTAVASTMRGPVRAAEIVMAAPMAVYASDVLWTGTRMETPVSMPEAEPGTELGTDADAEARPSRPAPKANDMADTSFRAARLREIAERLSGW